MVFSPLNRTLGLPLKYQYTCVFVYSGCHYKVLQTGWLKQQKAQAWRLQVRDQGVGGLVSSEGSPGLVDGHPFPVSSQGPSSVHVPAFISS